MAGGKRYIKRVFSAIFCSRNRHSFAIVCKTAIHRGRTHASRRSPSPARAAAARRAGLRLLMFTKKWSECSSGNEHREHEKLSSLSKRAKLRGPRFLSFFFGSLTEKRRSENRCLKKRWKVRRLVSFSAFRDCHRGHQDGENRSMGFLECPQVPFFYRGVPVRSRLPW